MNFVALLGWSPAEDREIYSLPELVEAFDYTRISKSPAVFDMTKLKWDERGIYESHGRSGVLRAGASPI